MKPLVNIRDTLINIAASHLWQGKTPITERTAQDALEGVACDFIIGTIGHEMHEYYMGTTDLAHTRLVRTVMREATKRRRRYEQPWA